MPDSPFHTLAARGLSVFPIVRPTKTPALPWSPYQTTRATPGELDAWTATTHNTGIATGTVSGCIVLDHDNVEALLAAMERGLPLTLTFRTPRGWHSVFQHPGGHCGNRANIGKTLGIAGWDIRGDGGYIVGPGSYYDPTPVERAKGKLPGHYTIETDVPIAPAPQWLLDLIARPDVPDVPPAPARVAETTSAYGRRAMLDELQVLTDAVSGEVNETLNAVCFAIGQLVGGGEIRADEATDALSEALAARGIGDEYKSLDTMNRALADGILSPRAAPPVPTTEALLGTRPSGEQPIVVPDPPAAYGPSFHPALVAGEMLQTYFSGCVYVASDDAMWMPGGVMLKKSGFDGIYGGPRFYLTATGDGNPTRSAWEAFRTNEVYRLPRVHRTCFRPEQPPGATLMLEGLPYLNAYMPLLVRRIAGDPEPFISHVRRMLPVGDDAEYLLHWMASVVQNPGFKAQWWPVVQGVKGNGKTLLLTCMMHAVGSRYSHLVRADAMQKTGNQFNAWIERKLFLGFEEIRPSEGKRDLVEMMKDTITNLRIASEGKGAAQDTVDNRANGMMLTNHGDGVPIDDDERRYGVFWSAQQTVEDLARDGMDGAYFPQLYDWLNADGYAIVAHYLATRPLSAAMDPAQDLHRAPVTSSTQSAREASLGRLEQEVLEAIEEGRRGFAGGIVSSVAIKQLFQSLHVNIGPRRFRQLMRAIGYDWHPKLPGGRVNTPLADQTKPRLYFRRGHPALDLDEPTDIAAAYETAQTGDVPPGSNVVALRR